MNFHDQKRRPRLTPDVLLSAFDEDSTRSSFTLAAENSSSLYGTTSGLSSNALSALKLKSQTGGPSSTTPAKTIVAKSYRRPGKDRQNL